MPHVLLGRRSGLLDLQRIDRSILDDEEVDLLLVLVMVVMEGGTSPVVQIALQKLRHDPGLEDRTRHGTGFQRFRTRPFRQIGAQARVEEIKLRCFHQTQSLFRP